MVDSVVTILGEIGALDREQVRVLSKRCRNCTVESGQTCGDCPAEDLGARLAVTHGWISHDQLQIAQRLRQGLQSRKGRERIHAATEIAKLSRQATERASKRLEAASQRFTRKSNPDGFPAVKIAAEG
jgi:hypothetical protein